MVVTRAWGVGNEELVYGYTVSALEMMVVMVAHNVNILFNTSELYTLENGQDGKCSMFFTAIKNKRNAKLMHWLT